MKKYKELYEEGKQRHEEALQRYQEDHTDEMEIINLHKKCNKKIRKVSQPKKASWSDEPKKVTELIDNLSEVEQKSKKADGKKAPTKVGQKVKKIPQPKKVPKTPEFVGTDSDDSDDEQGLTAKQPQKASKAPEFVDIGSSPEDEQEPTAEQPQKASKIPGGSDDESPQETSPGPVYKELTKKLLIESDPEDLEDAQDIEGDAGDKRRSAPPVSTSPQETSSGSVHKEQTKKLPATGCTPTTSCNHTLTSGIGKVKQCRFNASDETGKFCHHHKQT